MVERFENLGAPVLFGGHNLLPLVEIGLTYLPKVPVCRLDFKPLGDLTIILRIEKNISFYEVNSVI
jgi:hypothetical protein